MFYFLLDENIHILDSVVDLFGEVCVILPTVFHCVIAEALHLVLICAMKYSMCGLLTFVM
jgi:hypothetical protein